jgi:hypothetical protein
MSIFSINHIVMVRVVATQKSFQPTIEQLSTCSSGDGTIRVNAQIIPTNS